MKCDYFESGRCRSCSELPVAYAEQLAHKQAIAEQALARFAPALLGWFEAMPLFFLLLGLDLLLSRRRGLWLASAVAAAWLWAPVRLTYSGETGVAKSGVQAASPVMSGLS